MKVLSKEKTKVLAEQFGWSLTQAEGYVDGETHRRRGKIPSAYARVGMDDYCLGFRAGYYERQKTEGPVKPALVEIRHVPEGRLPETQSEAHDREDMPMAVPIVSAQGG